MTDARVKAVAKLESAVDPKLAEKIIAAVDEQSLVHMCCDVINIPSPTGAPTFMAWSMILQIFSA